ncbi:hypothetical protein DFH09DRAFT_1312387 [Mycena vulgaris]|nr:hypothetical protein DFH09DRAFT_1312387 [Mycena vulgaris]
MAFFTKSASVHSEYPPPSTPHAVRIAHSSKQYIVIIPVRPAVPSPRPQRQNYDLRVDLALSFAAARVHLPRYPPRHPQSHPCNTTLPSPFDSPFHAQTPNTDINFAGVIPSPYPLLQHRRLNAIGSDTIILRDLPARSESTLGFLDYLRFAFNSDSGVLLSSAISAQVLFEFYLEWKLVASITHQLPPAIAASNRILPHTPHPRRCYLDPATDSDKFESSRPPDARSPIWTPSLCPPNAR